MKVQYQSISPTWHTVLTTDGLRDFFLSWQMLVGHDLFFLRTICRIRSSYCTTNVVVFMLLPLHSMKFPVLVTIAINWQCKNVSAKVPHPLRTRAIFRPFRRDLGGCAIELVERVASTEGRPYTTNSENLFYFASYSTIQFR